MDRQRIIELLERVRSDEVSPEEAAEALRVLPYEDLDKIAVVDHHRELRSGIPEVVLGEWKTADDIARIVRSLADRAGRALATRVSPEKAAIVLEQLSDVPATYHEVARAIVVQQEPRPTRGRGVIAVTTAGTSDRPVAEEAAVTAEFLGHRVERLYDIGIAGLQRVVSRGERLRQAEVAIVIAGMEGALPSVVAGLIDKPVIAVPTSVGYGVGVGGFVAMMGMLTSCAPGLVVVNIDNGFGAAVSAALINGD